MFKALWKYFLTAAMVLTMAGVFYSQSGKLPSMAKRFPVILIYIIVFFTILMLIEQILKFVNKDKPKKKKNKKSDSGFTDAVGEIDYLKAFIFAVMIGIYVFTLKTLGYFIVTPVFIIASFMYLKSTSLRNAILITVGFNLFVYLVFVKFLNLPIPMGILS
ncbi:MAG: tripartite tricarboxylate transporter TctB family protein [Bacillota bacterium]